MQAQNFMRVEEVAQELGISKSHAYKVIHRLILSAAKQKNTFKEMRPNCGAAVRGGRPRRFQ